MIIIQQTTQPISAGNNTVRITDSNGADLLSNGADALQVDQAGLLTALADILAAITNGTGSGVLTDTSRTDGLSGSLTALASEPCKMVTLINLSTNTVDIIYRVNGGSSLNLEPGYSVRVNVSDADLIEVSSSAGENLQYIVTV